MRLACLFLCLLALLVASCGNSVTGTRATVQIASTPTHTSQPVVPRLTATPGVSVERSCEDWPSWPVIPTADESTRELYRLGQLSGNHPRAFSKVGDGEISAAWFFTAFDLGEAYYDLGPYQDLAPTIEYFSGSFGRIGMAARRGFNTHKILDPAQSDLSLCGADESPLTCELRLHRPAFAILSLGTNQVWRPDEFDAGMRQILDILLSYNVVPILSTKGDNLEGDHRINRTIACLSQEYAIPLWNFWAAIQPLPAHGLQPDLEHLTYGTPDFSDLHAMQTAWTVRNLTALQALDAVWKGVTAQP